MCGLLQEKLLNLTFRLSEFCLRISDPQGSGTLQTSETSAPNQDFTPPGSLAADFVSPN
jgi:hypothetical protein